VRELLAFLMEDCCGGNAEICAPLAAIAERLEATPAQEKVIRDATDEFRETVAKLDAAALSRGRAVSRQLAAEISRQE